MKRLSLLAVACVLVGSALAQDKKADDKTTKEELKKLEGTWKVTSAEMAGKKFATKDIGMEKVRFKDGKMTFVSGDKDRGAFEITLAPAKKPKHMDWVKDKKLASLPCIYELKDDELKICFPLLPGKDEKVKMEIKRPDGFDTKDKAFGTIVLKRDK